MDPLRPVLPPEILDQILKEAHKNAPLRGLRVVSTRFNTTIKVLVYRQVRLTKRIVSCFESYENDPAENQVGKDHAKIQVGKDVCEHTKHVSVDRELDWPVVERLLYSLKLEGIRWWSWGFNDIAQTSILDTISKLKSERPELRLSIGAPESLRNGPDGKPSLDNRPSPLSSYPFRHLSSCTVDQFCPVHAMNAPDLKEMLLGSPELEDLSLTWGIRKASRVRWHIRDGERLPPVTKLVLRGMYWNMSRSNAITFWNWSRISHLELHIVDISRFLKTVTAEHLPNLRTFLTDGWCLNMFVPADDHTKDLCNFVRDTQALEKLAMRCRVEVDKVLLYLEAVSKHASTLRSLEIRTLAHERHSEFGVRHLTALNTACPELRELGFDLVMNVKPQPPATLTSTIAGFRKMRSLTVYAYMWIEDREQGFNEGRATASAWIEDLVSSKQGVQLEKVIVKLEARKHAEGTYYSTISYTHDFRGVEEWHCEEHFKECRRRDPRHISWINALQLTEATPFLPHGYPFGYT